MEEEEEKKRGGRNGGSNIGMRKKRGEAGRT